MMKSTSLKVFISHASKDFKLADEIRSRLESIGVECWIAPRDIPPGSSYGEQITNAIKECVAVVFVLTEQANASKAVANELEMAFRHERLIIPIRVTAIEPSNSLAFFLNNVQWVDACFTPIKKRVEEISRIVSAVKNKEPIPKPASEHKTLVGTLEKKLESLIRYKLIMLSILFFATVLFAGLNLFSSSRILNKLDNEQDLINKDSSLFGLVKLSQVNEYKSSEKSIDIEATAYLNLRNTDKAKPIWKGFISGPNLTPIMIDVSPFSELTGPGAQIIKFSYPTNYNKIVFCLSALHPVLSDNYTAKWSFSLRSTESGINIIRESQDPLSSDPPESCK